MKWSVSCVAYAFLIIQALCLVRYKRNPRCDFFDQEINGGGPWIRLVYFLPFGKKDIARLHSLPLRPLVHMVRSPVQLRLQKPFGRAFAFDDSVMTSHLALCPKNHMIPAAVHFGLNGFNRISTSYLPDIILNS